jgi:hypothetical protein
MKTVVLIHDGPDGQEFVGVFNAPGDLDMAAARHRWQQWCEDVYRSPIRSQGRVGYISFYEWLIKKEGCSVDSETEVFDGC